MEESAPEQGFNNFIGLMRLLSKRLLKGCVVFLAMVNEG